MHDGLSQAPVGVIETTHEGQVIDVNERAASLIETTTDALADTAITASFPKSAAKTLRAAFEGETPTPQSFEEYYPHIERWLAVDIHVDDDVLVYVRDRTDSHEHERTVERLERRLDRVQQIDTLVVSVLRQVLDASGREEVGQTVCTGLGGTDRYRFAWVGDRDFAADRLRLLATSGTDSDLPEKIEDGLTDEATLPGQRALGAGETRLVEAIADDTSLPRGLRQAAFGQGLQSCLAVPLAYQGTVYGVVSIYSDREDGFSEQERVGLETLGSVAGFAIKATRQEELLVADTVTEVTLEVRDESMPFVRAARETNTQLSLAGAVPRGDGSVICYCSGSIEDIDTLLAADEAFTDGRWIRTDDEPLLEVTVTAETPVTRLVAWGATVSGAEYTSESAQLVAEAPPDEDVRRLVEAVDSGVAETTLLSKAERTRETDPVEVFRDGLADRLTDRQHTVLRTAHLSDYFASPRGSSAEEVAETLDIAGSTLLYHLRRAQQKLVDAYFATDPERPTE